MLEEIIAIENNQTWNFVKPPHNCKPIGVKLASREKKNHLSEVIKYKARLFM